MEVLALADGVEQIAAKVRTREALLRTRVAATLLARFSFKVVEDILDLSKL